MISTNIGAYLLFMIILFQSLSESLSVTEDPDAFPDTGHTDSPYTNHEIQNNKDRILYKSIKKLTFHRNRMTTSKRTHSIHQLVCIGGSAGCKLFAPDTVVCDRIVTEKNTPTWKCNADLNEKVDFNHVEIICEGYEYPEDDYILVGSCGLEFTLDYKDPYDYHEKSYFSHMDKDEKAMHHERVKASQKKNNKETAFFEVRSKYVFHAGLIVLILLLIYSLVRCLGKGKKTLKNLTYGPLTSAAVLNTKKAC